jgi:acetyl-CoA synthetase
MAHSNLARFLRVHGLDLAGLRERALDPVWFWDAVVTDLGIVFDEPYRAVLDTSAGIEWARWFVGGRLNLATTCLDQWAAATPEAPAVRWEGEDGEAQVLSYSKLRSLADQVANGLSGLGVAVGDVVGIYLPMVPEVVAVLYGCAKLGAIAMPMFSGYEAHAVALRLGDSGARVLVTADGFYRRGTVVAMHEIAQRAAELTPSLQHIVVLERISWTGIPIAGHLSLPWRDVITSQPATFRTLSLESEATALLCYTSGTMGSPKGAVLTHAGLLVGVAKDAAYHLDVRHDDTLFWVTDIGWIMGAWEIIAAGAMGATVMLYEGAPAHPSPDRIWELADRSHVTVLGVSPSLIRGLAASGTTPAASHELSMLRIIGATGEPWDADAWLWLFEQVGGCRCPIINMSGGTEVAGAFLAPLPLQPLVPCTLGGPALGLDVDVFGPDGRTVPRGSVGELVCKGPWPGMTRGLWRDPERYLDTYWRRWPGIWAHGDWASVDSDGFWYLHGRSDDTLNVAGKRLGPAEVEGVLARHPAVAEAAAVGLPHPVKGEAIWCFVIMRPGRHPTDALTDELISLVTRHLGKAFRPERVVFVADLPRTSSAKLVRRAIRAAAGDDDITQITGVENPGAIRGIRAALSDAAAPE